MSSNKAINIRQYIFSNNGGKYSRYWLIGLHISTPITFYYTPEETKRLHRNNLMLGFAPGFKQLLGADFNIPNYIYTRIINAYIKNEI